MTNNERRDDVIYAAGFVDGEGCIGVRVSHPRGVPTYAMRINVCQRDERPLSLLVSLWGGSLVLDRHRDRPIWRWTLQAYQAQVALEEMLPYLIVKRRQAEIAIRFQSRRVTLNRSRRVRLANEPENEADRLELLKARANFE